MSPYRSLESRRRSVSIPLSGTEVSISPSWRRDDRIAYPKKCRLVGLTLPDIGYGATQGDTIDEALAQAEDMLEEAVLGMIAHKEEVPVPSPANGRPVVYLPALTAAKLEVYRAMRRAGLDEAQLAVQLGWTPKQVTHLFDGYHAVRLKQLEAVLAAFGRRLVVTSEAHSPARAVQG